MMTGKKLLVFGLFLCFQAVPGVFAGTARNIILCIGDGMHLEHEIAASRYLYGEDRGLAWHDFTYSAPCTTWDVNTYDRYAWKSGLPRYSETDFNPVAGYDPEMGGEKPYPDLNVPVSSYYLSKLPDFGKSRGGCYPATDSAAAATAIATGRKTDGGNISWLPGDLPGGALETIAEKMRRVRGAAIGVVTTVPFNHATPAAFVSHNTQRGNYYAGSGRDGKKGIADEIITSVKPEVVIGAGHPSYCNPGWEAKKGYISKELYDNLRKSREYVFAERRKGADGGKSLARAVKKALKKKKKLFGLFGSGYFEHPVPVDSPGNPEVVFGEASLENPSLAEAALAALEVLSTDGEGFFLMVEGGDIDWANHANNYSHMIGAMYQFEEAVRAVSDFIEIPGDDIDLENTLVIVTSDHSNSYMRLVKPSGKGELPEQVYDDKAECWDYPGGEVEYFTRVHTNEPVMVYAMGCGAGIFGEYAGKWYPGTGITDNTHIYRVMEEAAGIAGK